MLEADVGGCKVQKFLRKEDRLGLLFSHMFRASFWCTLDVQVNFQESRNKQPLPQAITSKQIYFIKYTIYIKVTNC